MWWEIWFLYIDYYNLLLWRDEIHWKPWISDILFYFIFLIKKEFQIVLKYSLPGNKESIYSRKQRIWENFCMKSLRKSNCLKMERLNNMIRSYYHHRHHHYHHYHHYYHQSLSSLLLFQHTSQNSISKLS